MTWIWFLIVILINLMFLMSIKSICSLLKNRLSQCKNVTRFIHKIKIQEFIFHNVKIFVKTFQLPMPKKLLKVILVSYFMYLIKLNQRELWPPIQFSRISINQLNLIFHLSLQYFLKAIWMVSISINSLQLLMRME